MSNSWVIHYEIAAIVILAAVIILFFTGNRIHTKASKVFVGIMFTALFAAIFDELSVLCLANPGKTPIALSYITTILYMLCMVYVIFLYAIYIVSLTKMYLVYGQKGLIFISLPAVAEMVCILFTPLTHHLFYIDAWGIYHRGPGMNQIFVVLGLYMVYIAYVCIRRYRYLTKFQFSSVVFYTISALICIFLQIVLPEYLLNSFATAMGVLLVYISMQGDFIDSDKILGTYSVDALEKKINGAIESGKNFHIIFVRIAGFERMGAVFGFEAANEIMRQIAEFLMKIIPDHLVFHLSGMNFACYVEGGESVAFDYAVRIQDRFLQRFRTTSNLAEVVLPFKMVVMEVPKHVKDSETAGALANEFLGQPVLSDENYIVMVDQKLADKFERRRLVEQAIERGIRNGAFEVYYQPIIDIEKGRVCSAEALVRLHDEVLGDIYPDEFIPIAEKNSSMAQVSAIVLHRVCSFIIESKITKKGLDYIEVNLSDNECSQAGSAEKLISIIKSYNLPLDVIRFEFNESTVAGRHGNTRTNFEVLLQNGSNLVMDGFGTGYSNAAELINTPIDIIKVDKSLLWMAIDDSDAMVVLEGLVGVIKGLKRTVLVTGVEDAIHQELLTRLDIRYAQGYYYSRPVDKDTFLEYVRDVNEYGMSPCVGER